MLKIWGRRNSINVQKVLWTAELCGQRYESIEVGGPFGGTDTTVALSAEVAVKCDLCRTYEEPGCVTACPTESIFRLEPTQDIAAVASLFGTQSGPRRDRTKANELDRGSVATALVIGASFSTGVVAMVAHARDALAPSGGVGLSGAWIAFATMFALAASSGSYGS